MCLIWFFCQWYEKLNCKGISLLRNQKGHYWYLLILLSPYNLCLLLCPSLHEMSLSIAIFLKRSLVFLIILFSSISMHWSLRKSFLSLLAILWNSAFKCVYLFFSPLPFTSLHFTAIDKASSDNHFAFLHLFFLGMVLITASCTILVICKDLKTLSLKVLYFRWCYSSFLMKELRVSGGCWMPEQHFMGCLSKKES